MFVNNFIQSEDAFLTPFMAIVLPIILLMGALILESGNFYIRQEQLRGIAKQSANSGLIVFSQTLNQRAVVNKNTLCSVEIPPASCSSENMLDFLTMAEIQNQILILENQNKVVQNIKSFAYQYDPLKKITNEEISVQFPFNYSGGNKLKVKVLIRENPPQFFSRIGKNNDEIVVEEISFLSLN